MVVTPKRLTPQLREMQQADVFEIALIEKKVFPDPWSENLFHDCFRLGYTCRVLENNSMIQAYGIIVIEHIESHILNLCVRSELRQKGFGRMMLDHLLDLARTSKTNTVSLEVNTTNLPAIQLYKSAGFHQIDILKEYYPQSDEGRDAIVMKLDL